MTDAEIVAALGAPRKWEKDDETEQNRLAASAHLAMRFLQAFENIAQRLENIDATMAHRA